MTTKILLVRRMGVPWLFLDFNALRSVSAIEFLKRWVSEGSGAGRIG